MKKTRVLILLLAVLLMFTCVLFVACNDDDDEADCSEGHDWKNANNPKRQKLIQSRTCTLPEIRERECKVCKTTEQYESEQPTGHIYDTTKKIYLNDATCTENGHTVNHCYWYEICGYTADIIEEVPNSKTGHTFLNYVPSATDPTVGVAKCTDCDVTDELLLGFDLDMEGDRAHIGYQALGIYTANDADAFSFVTVGTNTYLEFNRPADGYLGGSEFGATLAPNKFMLDSATYVVEVTLMLDGANNDVVIVGKKALKGQQMEFIRYNAADKTIEGVTGALYGLDADDLANGVHIAIVVNDGAQWYQVYVNNDLVSGAIAFEGDYFVGFDLATIDIVSMGTDATVFGIDNLKLHKGSEPEDYEDGVNLAYATEDLGNGEKVSYKKPADGCTHAYAPKKVVAKTCTTYGYTLEECSVCNGQRITNKVAPPDDHSWDDDVETIPPTCLEAGYTVSTCTVCGIKKGEANGVEATGHKHGAGAEVIDATCTSDKVIKGNCEVCNTYFEETKLGTKLKHELGEDATVTLPTCSTEGFTSGPCVHCGVNYIDDTTKVATFDHYYFELDEHKDATCSSEGYDLYTCLSCNKQFKDNVVATTGHKTYSTVKEVGGLKEVTNYCVNCAYSYTYKESTKVTTYDDVVATLGNKLLEHYYQDTAANKSSLKKDGGNPYVNDGVAYKNGAFRNMENNEYARFISGPSGADSYFNFPTADKGISTNRVWEFDVKFPDADEKFTESDDPSKNTAYENGGVTIGFSCNTNDAVQGAGANIMKIYPDGSIVLSDIPVEFTSPDNFYTANYPNTSATVRDIEFAPAGTVTSDGWTRIAIVLNYTDGTVSAYVNGVGKTMLLPKYFAAKMRYIRFNFMHVNNKLSAMDFRNMFFYEGTQPTYLKAPAALVDVMNTDFTKDSTGGNVPSGGLVGVTDLSGSLGMVVNDGLVATLNANQLEYVTTSATAGSMVYGDISAYIGKTFTTRTETKITTSVGDYTLVGLSGAEKRLPIVYIKDGKLKITGSDYELPLSGSDKFTVDVVVKGGAKTYDVYIKGILVASGISYADTDFGKATQTAVNVEYYYINESSDDISIVISQIKVFDGEVIPDYYVGVLQSYDAPGYKDVAVSFTGNEKLGELLPVNTKIPGGYYYTEVLGQSYLSLAVTPATEKIAGNVRYTKVNGSGAMDVEDGFNAIAVGSFKTNGIYNLKFENLFGIKSTATGYDISDYVKMITRFYVNDATAGYTFKIVLYKGTTEYEVYKGAQTTGWHVLESDITGIATDEIDAIGIIFDGEGCGVGGDTNTDKFSFALENISFETASTAIPGTSYVFKPHSDCKNNSGTYSHSYSDTTVSVEAECDAHGYIIKTCNNCGYLDVEIVERTGHNYSTPVSGQELDANCETAGYQYYACDCGAQSKEIINKLEHNFVFDENATELDGKKAATCTDAGLDIYICTNPDCNHGDKKFGMVTEALGHTPAAGATETVTIPVSCINDGTTRVSECANCGEAYDVTVEATDHNYKDVVVPATCTEDGESYKICTNAHCDVEGGKIVEYAVLTHPGHTLPAQYLLTRVEVTCTHASGWQYECLVCGETDILVDDGVTPHPHTWSEWNVEIPNDCGNDGFRDKTCAECGGKISELGNELEKADCIILATGIHTWADDYTYSEDYEAGVRGEKWYDCEVCDAINGLQSAGTEGLVFTYNNVDTYVITGYTGSATEIVIPAIFKGKPVMLGNALAGNTAITSVTFANGASISDGAFAGCTALETVVLPEGITAIPLNAFNGCCSLESIVLPASCTEIRTFAFAGCTALESITIKGTLTSVQMMAFADCTSLTEVKYVTDNIPYLVIAEIGNDAFLAENIWSAIA